MFKINYIERTQPLTFRAVAQVLFLKVEPGRQQRKSASAKERPKPFDPQEIVGRVAGRLTICTHLATHICGDIGLFLKRQFRGRSICVVVLGDQHVHLRGI